MPSPVLQSPDGAPQHPLAAAAGVAVGVEEGHRGTALPRPAGIPAPLKPQAHSQDQQDKDDEQHHAEKHQGEQQLPQQPETQGNTITLNVTALRLSDAIFPREGES